MSLPFPYLHVFEFPWLPIVVPHWALWILRMGVGLAFAGGSIFLILRPTQRWIYVPLLCAGVTLAIPSLVSAETASRYLYIPSSFFALFVGCFLSRFSTKALIPSGIYVGLVLIPGIWSSGTLRSLRQTAEHVELLVESLREKSVPTGSTIVIANHPHVAPEPHNWIYRQLLFDVLFPEKAWHFGGEIPTSSADWVFRFDASAAELVLVTEGSSRATP
jgi:hypothetical protein